MEGVIKRISWTNIINDSVCLTCGTKLYTCYISEVYFINSQHYVIILLVIPSKLDWLVTRSIILNPLKDTWGVIRKRFIIIDFFYDNWLFWIRIILQLFRWFQDKYSLSLLISFVNDILSDFFNSKTSLGAWVITTKLHWWQLLHLANVTEIINECSLYVWVHFFVKKVLILIVHHF